VRFSRPYFDVDAYAAGRHCGSTGCRVAGCNGLAVSEFCKTLGGEPTSLDMWFPLCHEHRNAEIPNWREPVDSLIRSMVDFSKVR